MSNYGKLPTVIKSISAECEEFMFYQYMPIKLKGGTHIFCAENDNWSVVEKRLLPFFDIIGAACCDFVALNGVNGFVNSYVYITAKHMQQSVGCPINRPGWHSDGFGTNDINYIWYSNTPTIFNCSEFNLPPDDEKALEEMTKQALMVNNMTYVKHTLLRLDQYCIHRAGDAYENITRTFLKISFSKDKYDLVGNSHNYRLDYDWKMRPRKETRNVPQAV